MTADEARQIGARLKGFEPPTSGSGGQRKTLSLL